KYVPGQVNCTPAATVWTRLGVLTCPRTSPAGVLGPGVGLTVGVGLAVGVGLTVGVGLAVAEVVGCTPPVQATPSSAKSVGTGLDAPLEPWTPSEAAAAVPWLQLHPALASVTFVPDCVIVPFHS